MFGRSRPVFFDPRGRRHARWRPPAWLVLLLAGTAVGATAVVVVQERYLPPRLTVAASAQLRAGFEEADAERQRLRTEVADARQRLAAELAGRRAASDALGQARADVERLRRDVLSAVTALPPDPRGGTVEIRAGRFSARPGQISYDLVLSRDGVGSQPLPGVLQLQVAGDSDRGTPSTLSLPAVALSMGPVEVVRGSLPLPAGFRPRQTTVHVLDRAAGRSMGMRVLPVK